MENMKNKKPKYPFLDTTLTYEQRVADLLSRLTLDEKIKMLSTHHYAVERLGLKSWYIGTECARGYVTHDSDKPSTVFPQPIGMSSTFDPEIMEKVGEIAGNEFRAYYNKNGGGGLMVWGPTVDMERDPRWGRTEEAYGEDPFLTGQMSIGYTKGLRGNDKVMKTLPTLKHFCADNNEKNRGSCSANLDPRTKHEYYYAAFKPSIVKGGAYSMMAAYNELSGVPAILNPELDTIIKDEWGLGFVVSDGGDFSQTVCAHEYCRSHAESLALTLKAGCDTMTDNAELVHKSAYEALKLGYMTEADIDKAVGNSLDGRFRLGEFDGGTIYDDITTDIVNCDEYKKVNLQVAKEGVTLLKNEGLLPLKKGKTVALIGSLADKNLRDWYTGYSTYLVSVKKALEKKLGKKNVIFDNGYDRIAIKSVKTGKYLTVDKNDNLVFSASKVGKNETFEYHDWDFDVVNLFSCAKNKFIRLQGKAELGEEDVFSWFTWETLHIRDYNGKTLVENRMHKDVAVDDNGMLTVVEKGRPDDSRLFEIEILSKGTDRIAELSKQCDYAVVCVGNHPLQVARECYDRPDITLPRDQTALVKTAFENNKNTLELIISSYPYAINWEKENLNAIVYTSHAGPELGNAVVSVLYGEYNPAGRTPMTWYKSVLDLPDIFDYDIISNDMTYQYFKGDVCYPFGYGLSYSDFDYKDCEITQDKDNVYVKLYVTNTSDIDGDEVVQVYYTLTSPRVKRPIKKLCGFKRVNIKAFETKEVLIAVEKSELEFYDVTREKFTLESGEYVFMIGASSEDIRITENVIIKGEKIPPRNLRELTKAINYDFTQGTKMLWSKLEEKHFMTMNGWNGYLMFKDCKLDKASSIQVRASAYCAKRGKIKVCLDSLNGPVISEVVIDYSMAIDDFEIITAPMKKVSGRHDVYLVLEGDAALLDFKFI